MLVYHLLKTKNEYTNLKETRYIYQNDLHKDFYQYDMTYADFKEFSGETASVLRDIGGMIQ